jgi:cation:H+ antiporter
VWLSVLLLLLGLALIIKGGDLFVASSVRIAALLRVPRVLIGTTLVSLATTSPELVVSVTASLRGEPGLAIGNAVGSCIANIALIVGTVAVLRPVSVVPVPIRAPFWIMVGLGLLVFGMTVDLRLGFGRGIILVLLAAGYVVFDFYRHKTGRAPEEAAEVEVLEEGLAGTPRFRDTGVGSTLVFATGAAMVIVGSRFLVDSGISIAGALGVPPIVIGLTVVAIGTSLPEYVTAIVSTMKGVSDLSVGNILGANILNLGLIVGASAMIHEVEMSRVTQLYNFPVMLLVMGLLGVSLLVRRRLSRGPGGLLLGVYAAYVTGLTVLAALGHIPVTE